MTNQTAKTHPTTCYSPITLKSLRKKSNVDIRHTSSVQFDRFVTYVVLHFRE